MAKSLFPSDMMGVQGTLTLDEIFAKLGWFELQSHLLHLQTKSFAEHKALDEIYQAIPDFRDSFSERIMGYQNSVVKSKQIDSLYDYSPGKPEQLINELKNFAKQVETFGSLNGMPDIENIAQDLNGTAAKCLYLLTLS